MEDENKLKIREAALELFNLISFSKTTVSNIAEKAGIGKGTVYLYYKTKDDILASIIDKMHQKILEERRKYNSDKNISLEEKIKTFANDFVNTFVEIKRLTFGSFEDVTGNIVRDILSKASNKVEISNSTLTDLLKLHEVNINKSSGILKQDIKEFIEYMIGRTVLYFLKADWENSDQLRENFSKKIYSIFKAVVIQ